jgi:hypothetical protein
MKRTDLAVFVKHTGSSSSPHTPALLGCLSAREKLEDMLSVPGAHFESSARFITECNEDVECFDVVQLEVQVPAYGRIHQAIPA